ncbi:hypothetical protein [Bosea sp. AS-1]|uniref:hypothetical protein n=1 Tax=Bosea sp. AS-1 TaxID=2015316 RepID=UPI000B791D60|nr:hypothetical protein [Bosea sp. AS-1]
MVDRSHLADFGSTFPRKRYVAFRALSKTASGAFLQDSKSSAAILGERIFGSRHSVARTNS